MGKLMALKGNATTTGGTVLDGEERDNDHGHAYAYHMGRASCARCGRTGPIFGTATTWGVAATHGVLDGDIVMCDCPPGVNRVIAQSTTTYNA